MATNLLSECAAGYHAGGRSCPFLFSSDCWLAWQAGHELAIAKLSEPTRCTKGRGYTVNVTTQGARPEPYRYVVRFEGKALDTAHIEGV